MGREPLVHLGNTIYSFTRKFITQYYSPDSANPSKPPTNSLHFEKDLLRKFCAQRTYAAHDFLTRIMLFPPFGHLYQGMISEKDKKNNQSSQSQESRKLCYLGWGGRLSHLLPTLLHRRPGQLQWFSLSVINCVKILTLSRVVQTG